MSKRPGSPNPELRLVLESLRGFGWVNWISLAFS
jgi:hypothetical protein